jgi:peptidoglycan hydrolase-like protein with peptidoglycan-binding domain
LENSYGAAYGDYGGDATLSKGDTGSKVRELQNLLILAGFGSALGKWGADGDFGKKTQSAVRAFQSAKGLSVTGRADQATWSALRGKSSSPTSVVKKGWSNDDDDDDDEPKWWEGIGDTFVDAFRGDRPPPVSQPSVGLMATGTAKKPVPWGWIIGGTLGVGAIITIAVVASKRGKK